MGEEKKIEKTLIVDPVNLFVRVVEKNMDLEKAGAIKGRPGLSPQKKQVRGQKGSFQSIRYVRTGEKPKGDQKPGGGGGSPNGSIKDTGVKPEIPMEKVKIGEKVRIGGRMVLITAVGGHGVTAKEADGTEHRVFHDDFERTTMPEQEPEFDFGKPGKEVPTATEAGDKPKAEEKPKPSSSSHRDIGDVTGKKAGTKDGPKGLASSKVTRFLAGNLKMTDKKGGPVTVVIHGKRLVVSYGGHRFDASLSNSGQWVATKGGLKGKQSKMHSGLAAEALGGRRKMTDEKAQEVISKIFEEAKGKQGNDKEKKNGIGAEVKSTQSKHERDKAEEQEQQKAKWKKSLRPEPDALFVLEEW